MVPFYATFIVTGCVQVVISEASRSLLTHFRVSLVNKCVRTTSLPQVIGMCVSLKCPLPAPLRLSCCDVFWVIGG